MPRTLSDKHLNVTLLSYLADSIQGYLGLFLDAVRWLPRIIRSEPERQVLMRQIYFSGIEVLPLLSLAALALGYVGLERLYGALGRDMEQTLRLFRSLLVQGSSVLVVILYVLARSGSAMASELAMMKQNREILHLYRAGIDPGVYLVAPRIWGMIASVAALTVYYQVIMVLGGLGLMSLSAGWDFYVGLEIFLQGIEPESVLLNGLLSILLGATVAVVACRQGLLATKGARGVPVATRTAFVHGFAAVILLYFLFTILFFE